MNKIKVKIKNKEINVNLLNDFLFGKLFGEIGCEKETLHLINTFTKRNFKNLNFKLNELKGKYKNNKKSITDVLVIMNDGSIVNIESQIKKQKKFHKRTNHYYSKINTSQLEIGKDYEEIPLIIMINILDFNLHPIEEYHTTFRLTEQKYREYTIKDMIETHYIDLIKFRKKVKNGKFDINDPKDRITLLLDVKAPQNLIKKVIEMDEFANTIYKKTLHVLKDKQEYLTYIRAEQAEIDRKAEIICAKKEGIEEGKKEGKEEGIKEGKKEKEEELAKKLINKGIPIEIIAETTNIPISKIEKF